MSQPILIADNGCDRATAYHMSNKIVRRPDGVYVTWLNAEYQAVVSRVNFASGVVEKSFALHQGSDDHCGAALTEGPDGCMHFMGGSHANAFVYRCSERPADPGSWSLPQAVGLGATYPSLVCNRDGDLLLTHRMTLPSGCWGVNFMRRQAGQWSWPFKLVQMPAPLYSFPTNTLALGSDGTLHMVVEFYKTYPDRLAMAHSMAVAHFESPDNGVTWLHTDGRPVAATPICLEDTSPVIFKGGGDVRPGNVVVMPDNQPVFPIYDSTSGAFWLAVRRSDRTWTTVDLAPAMQALHPGWRPCYQGQVALDRTGNLLVATTLAPEPAFAPDDSRIGVLRVDPHKGRIIGGLALEQTSPGTPDWMPNIEKNSVGVPNEDPCLLYQNGRNGAGCVNDSITKVYIYQLDQF